MKSMAILKLMKNLVVLAVNWKGLIGTITDIFSQIL